MKAFKATATLESLSPYSQTKYHGLKKEPGERDDDFEERTWIHKMSVGENGNVIIQAAAFKGCLVGAGMYLGMKIPGQGNKTFTQKFKSGVMVLDHLDTGVPKSDIIKVPLFVPSDGKSGGKGTRVVRNFPTISEWNGDVVFHVFDNTISKDILMTHLECMGMFIGVGNYRPQNGGTNGRFKCTKLKWESVTL